MAVVTIKQVLKRIRKPLICFVTSLVVMIMSLCMITTIEAHAEGPNATGGAIGDLLNVNSSNNGTLELVLLITI